MVSKLFLFVFVSLWSFSLNALQDDRKAPIKVVSDRAEQNEKDGTAIYQGSVVVRQGSIIIHADKVTIVTDIEDGDRIVCVGNPAKYQQIINTADGLVLASANTIQ